MTTSSTGAGAAGSATRQDVSGAMTSVIVRYVRNRAGEGAVAEMLRIAGEVRPAEVLENPTSWSSHDETIALFNAAAGVTGDKEIGRHVGEEMLRQHDGTEVANLLRSLGSPGELLRNVAAAAAKFTTVSTMEPLEVGDAHAVVRAFTRPGLSRHLQMCDFTKGLLSQVPVLFGLVPGVVAESECQARGGRFCLYSVAWEARQWSSFVDERSSLYTMAWGEQGVVEAQSELELDEQTRNSLLQEQISQLTTRLEAVYSTAADLLATDDLEGVLSRITDRAAHAVNAPRYLLVVRTSPDAQHQLHQRGFSDADARGLAEDLLREHPDDHGGSWLIVDIASSRRHYGRLAAVYPEGVQFFAQERRTLAVYADYAATALDVVTALDEARRSNQTASALLDFSRDLARVDTVRDVTVLLANAVPPVVGCERATVMLWDPDSEALIVRARSGDSLEGREAAPERAAPDEAPESLDRDSGGAPGTGSGEAQDGDLPDEDGEESLTTIQRSASPLVDQLLASRDVVVLDRSHDDPLLHGFLTTTGTESVAMAPIVSAGDVLGFVSANFDDRPGYLVRGDVDGRARLAGLADQAAVALQNARSHETISHLAWHDALTGLPNRRLLGDRVNQELIRAKRSGEAVSMFFVDLDRFKQVNDTLGHAAGDDLIQQVAKRLCETVRRQDTVARLGGDEFAVLLPGLSDPAAIEQLAHRALDMLNRPYLIEGQEVHTSASIGVATAPIHGATYDELLSNADAAMYRSKGLGRNTFQVFDGEEAEVVQGTVQLESDLHHAIERGELFVLYQPFIDLQTTAVVGVEALARWMHPTRGVLEPDSFIPMAEESNLIVAIDSWVVTEACRQIRRWQGEGLPQLRIAANVSTRDLASDDFVEAVHSALAETGIEPSLLELEVTERVVMDDLGVMGRNVGRLQDLGLRFAIDDFGSGNSALSRIGTFPVSTLKIDQSFVQVLGPEGESTALVSAIINLAQSLGIDCVAEGVETSHQSRILLQRGCTTAQGFFFSPPLLPKDVERMLGEIDTRAGGPGGPGGPGEEPEATIHPAYPAVEPLGAGGAATIPQPPTGWR